MTAPSPPAIEARNLTRVFGDNTAVDHLSLAVQKGEIFGIVGPDGAGKTTTLRMLAGILDPTSGSAAVDGFDTRTQAFAVKEHLAYMSQRFGLYPDLTILENLLFYADLYGVPPKERNERIDTLLGATQMRPFRQRRAGTLSGGMKQKLQLICALIHTPAVLLLDEPTNGVDPVSRRDFWRILYDIAKQGGAILVTTAYMDEAERCDRIGLLDRGRLLAAGTLSRIKNLMEGEVLTLQSPVARKIHQILNGRLEGASANVFGDRVHMVCTDPEAAEAAARTLLREAGLEPPEFQKAAPSLEDVFVSMMGDRQTQENKTSIEDPDLLPPDGESPALTEKKSGSRGPAVTVDDLTRVFGNFRAVDRISFSVQKGEIFGFLGPNGAGKSTTIRMLCGLLSPSSGRGRVAGFDIGTQPEKIKQHIGYMSQKFSLYEDLTVGENIRFYGGIYGLAGKQMARRRDWALAMAGLAGHENSLTAVLSAGWKQRLALACAILHEPPILFLDEPTSGVDPVSRRRFWDMIYQMADQGVTVFVTTHYMEEAEYCDRIALIYRGKMIAMGTPVALKTRSMTGQTLPSMEEVFISLIEADDRKQQDARGKPEAVS
ncbi:MAG: ATP-binding cassette domain-containing protein [Desulfotignum sp.]